MARGVPRKPNAKVQALGQRMRALRESRGLSQREVAARLDKTEDAYRHVESGRAGIGLEELDRYAVALDASVSELLEALGLLEPGGIAGPLRAGPVALVPLVRGVKLSAGPGWSEPLDWLPVLPELLTRHPRLIAVPVEGDCMEPELTDGSTAFVDPTILEPRDGQVVAVLTEEGKFLVKRFRRVSGRAELHDNQGRVIRPNGAQIRGIVVWSGRPH